MLDYREITGDQIDELAELYVETFNAPPWNDSWTLDTARKRLHQMIHTEDFYGLSVYTTGQLCGMIFGNREQFFDGVQFNIKEFCIKNTMQGHGVGTEVFREFESRLREKGIGQVILFTLKGDTERFYQKQGLESYSGLTMMGKKL